MAAAKRCRPTSSSSSTGPPAQSSTPAATWPRTLGSPAKLRAASSEFPDASNCIRVGRSHLIALPAHFLRAEGNFQFCDSLSRILYSGDLGARMIDGTQARKPMTSLATLPPFMERFHRRYWALNKVLQLWADMVIGLDIHMMAPQHGAPLAGPAVKEFIAWARGLQCGVDLMGAGNYRVPG